jgi:hypothetical protein
MKSVECTTTKCISTKKNEFIFLVLLALLASIWGYQYGIFDHEEHLPLAFRAADEDYLQRDFFVQWSSEGFSPRQYFLFLLAYLQWLLPLPFWYWLLTYCTNFGIAYFSAAFAGHWFGRDSAAVYWSGAFALGLVTLSAGSDDSLRCYYFTPSIGVIPLVLGQWWHLEGGRWLRAGLWALLACLLHPLVGALCGLILFGAYTVEAVYRREGAWAGLWGWLGLVLGLVLALGPYLLVQQGERLPSLDFVQLYGWFRHPHHIYPSAFLAGEEGTKAWYALGVLLCSVWAFARLRVGQHGLALGLVFLALAVLVLGGYVFVELWPQRLWVTAQAFRFLFLLKWLVLMQWAAWRADKPFGPWPLLLGSLSWPVWLGQALALVLWPKASFLPFVLWGLAGVAVGSTAWPQWWILALPLLMGLLAHWAYRGQGMKGAAMVLVLFAHWCYWPRTSDLSPLRQGFAHQWSLSDLEHPHRAMAADIRHLTPDTALILAPPNAAYLRLLAGRALVVDFKTFPFYDRGLKEWNRRLTDCYGETDLNGFRALWESFMPYYRSISWARLQELRGRYGFEYALVLADSGQLAWPLRPIAEEGELRLYRVGE